MCSLKWSISITLIFISSACILILILWMLALPEAYYLIITTLNHREEIMMPSICHFMCVPYNTLLCVHIQGTFQAFGCAIIFLICPGTLVYNPVSSPLFGFTPFQFKDCWKLCLYWCSHSFGLGCSQCLHCPNFHPWDSGLSFNACWKYFTFLGFYCTMGSWVAGLRSDIPWFCLCWNIYQLVCI